MTQDTPRGTSPIDIDAALANPSACFARPKDVLTHPGLSRALQLKILTQWEHDARGLAEAESEGMGGGEESMLGRVRQAIRTLERAQAASTSDPDEAQASIGRGGEKSIAGGIQEAAAQVQHAASRAQIGVIEIQEAIRAQPITAALIVFALGYLVGRLGALIPSGSSSSR